MPRVPNIAANPNPNIAANIALIIEMSLSRFSGQSAPFPVSISVRIAVSLSVSRSAMSRAMLPARLRCTPF